MAEFFQSWIFWFLIGLILLHFICKESIKRDKEKFKQKYKNLSEYDNFEVTRTQDLKTEGVLFKNNTDLYNQAFDIIFFDIIFKDDQTTITIKGVEYKFVRNINAFSIYEKITNKKFNLQNIHDFYILIYCLLIANNPGLLLGIDEFLMAIEECEMEGDSSEEQIIPG